jgi:5-methyltetrahydrofolate--homocysteine methyltransferase
MEVLEKLAKSLEAGKADEVETLTKAAISAGLDAKTILDDGLIAGMGVVGAKFKAHEIFLPDVLFAAKAMYVGMDLLKPLMLRDNISTIGKVVIGTVQGDLHDIGKNLVGIMLRGAGFEVYDLGRDVSPEQFISEAKRVDADVVGMSALLTPTMPVMAEVIRLGREGGLDARTRFIVGGAPLSDEYAKEIGADAYCFDGVNTVERVKQLVGVKSDGTGAESTAGG